MMMKYVNYTSPLWRTAVQAFTRAVTYALPIVARNSGIQVFCYSLSSWDLISGLE